MARLRRGRSGRADRLRHGGRRRPDARARGLRLRLLRRRRTAQGVQSWPLFVAACVVIFATELLGGGDVDPTWVLLTLAAPLPAYSLRPGALHAPGGLPLRIAAMVVFGGAAALALGLGGDAAAYLVAGGLLGHALWDARHHRIDRVVVRPYAEFCLVLDVVVAALVVIVTLNG
ncbi:hypothetical protein [Streptomyces sp. NPDC050263]|uniref:hypothetical protein n=1 Tax=Streptomyces sp. NPDC050263 TaxID=3155037 RepID=UPI00341B3292